MMLQSVTELGLKAIPVGILQAHIGITDVVGGNRDVASVIVDRIFFRRSLEAAQSVQDLDINVGYDILKVLCQFRSIVYFPRRILAKHRPDYALDDGYRIPGNQIGKQNLSFQFVRGRKKWQQHAVHLPADFPVHRTIMGRPLTCQFECCRGLNSIAMAVRHSAQVRHATTCMFSSPSIIIRCETSRYIATSPHFFYQKNEFHLSPSSSYRLAFSCALLDSQKGCAGFVHFQPTRHTIR